MKWIVRWRKGARTELADIWLKADSAGRKAITTASYRIEVELSRDPETKGESRDQGRRIFFQAPLGVFFRVDPATVTVMILHVWQFAE